MKIIHLSVCRKFSRGQRNQLEYEYNAAKTLGSVEWTTVGYHVGSSEGVFIKKIPLFFRGLFLRNLYGWLIAFKMSKTYDVVLMRHMTFDPFALVFAPFIPNRVSVHHAKEIEELKLIREGWSGKLASLMEKICGKVAVCNAKMILGVTNEIAEYEREVRCPSKKISVYPNGVELDSIALLKDHRKPEEINVVFICGTFSPWHGLDRLFDALVNTDSIDDMPMINIHLIGNIPCSYLQKMDLVDNARIGILRYGLLAPQEYREIMSKADFGIGSLAMDRQNLKEGSTLKIREMLALGLPVFSGHFDLALPQSVPWVKVVGDFTLADLVDFGVSVKGVERATVRKESASLIEKRQIMKNVIDRLKS